MSKMRFLKFKGVNVLGVFLLLVLLGSYTQIFAIASPYSPGATLDPECAPGEANCTVSIGGEDSPWLTGENGISYTGGNVGVGVSNPTSSLTTANNYTVIGSELVTNGNFDENADGWDIGDGVYADGKITETYSESLGTYADAYTNITTEEGKIYLVSFTLSNVINDSVVIQLYNNNVYADNLYGNGHYAFTFVSEYTGSDELYFSIYDYIDNSSYVLDDVSVREISTLSPSFEVLDIGGNSFLKLGGTRNYLGNLFLGERAGKNVDDVYLYGSNFIGNNAGNEATDASYSNFLGTNAGYRARYADSSNFLGYFAGHLAEYARSSNFLGFRTGYGATNAEKSNFLGNEAGREAINAYGSNFFGYEAGYLASGSHDSNFIGSSVGQSASDAHHSNFIGYYAGYQATSASYSNFLGFDSGSRATNALYSNFFGYEAGENATNAANSSFIGYQAGRNSYNSANSIFIGKQAGNSDTVNNTLSENDWSILIGNKTRTGGYKNSVLIGGSNTTSYISNTKENQFMLAPTLTEMRLRGVDYTLPSSQGGVNTVLTNNGSGVLSWAGPYQSQLVSGTNIKTINSQSLLGSGDITFGSSPIAIVNSTNLYSTTLGAGSGVTTKSYNIFMGVNAGYQAVNAYQSNFFGLEAGSLAINANNSNFLGENAGGEATGASTSNFLGSGSGYAASGAYSSNFLGFYAGHTSTSAYSSNFLGYAAGENAPSASNSIFIGTSAGKNDTVNNTTDWNDYSILIGNNTKTGGYKNSIALGASAINTASNQFVVGSSTRPIDTTVIIGSGGTICTLTTGTGVACSSDENLKTNITDLDTNILEKLSQVKTVNFNWKNGDTTSNNIGFIAQDLEKYFPELVRTDDTGYKSVYYANMTPILTEAIRELNLKVEESMTSSAEPSLMSLLFDTVIKSVSNGIAYMKDIVVDSIKVGSPEKRTGITLYDEITGQPYCFSISDGEPKTIEGECGIIYEKEEVVDSETPPEKEELINDETEEKPDLIIEEITDEEDQDMLKNELVEEEQIGEQTTEVKITDEGVDGEINEEGKTETETESSDIQA